ncbi:hypothetical protein RRF57_000074 [Xylaria bambusicola]|uniref:Uncharacterized protein n=1 Tax=Xylaria bambusicola TaxID=326684 RepID=A0AAN7U9L1_9PEZI
MGCCGSEDDYYTVTPYRPPSEKPHPSVQYQRHPERHSQPRHRDLRREEAEKRQRQAQATAAARNYGWPTTRGVTGNTHQLQGTGSRDSIIEPSLVGGLAAMPGSDFRAVYDPQHPRQRQQQQQQRQPVHRPNPLPPYQHPPYYQQRFVSQQPLRMPMMSAASRQEIPRVPRVLQEGPLARRQQVIARKPVIQELRTQFHAPQVARLVRRDSNGISECSDDAFDREELRQYTVSPIQSPPAERSYRTR